MRKHGLTILLGLALVGPAAAQGPAWRFRWQPGQVLPYRVEQTTTVTEVVGGKKVEMTAKVSVLKHWQVLDVDAQGVATLKLTLAAMRNEQKRPDGSVLLYDSSAPDKSTPELREQMAKYVGQPLAVLRVDGQGQVVEVKQSEANRFESDLPFLVTLPAAAPAVGGSWERVFKVTLDPSQGSGQYEAVQKYVYVKADASAAVIALTTQFRTQPELVQEQAPLLQKQPAGEVVFDVRAGRLHSARLQIDKMLTNHQGEGSSYRFVSSYTEQYAGSN
jgi:hypothetical protein